VTWTTQLNERLAEMHKAGASNDLVSRELGIPKRSIINQLSQLGLTRQPNRKPHKKQDQGSVTLLNSIQPYTAVSKHKKCQYIEGKPTIDDACKCGEPAQVGSSYCPPHHAVCCQKPPAERAA